MKEVLIIGMGLMGGSLAAALKKTEYALVSGVDNNPESLRIAREKGFADRTDTDFRKFISSADIVVFAAPVREIIRTIPEAASLAKNGAIFTDLGSTKEKILKCMDALPERLFAVGGHPMCGKFTAGIENAEAGLFQGKTFVYTPGKRTNSKTIAAIIDLIKQIGGLPKQLSANEHDKLVALTSHLPRILPVAILAVAQKKEQETIAGLMGGNFKQSTFLATDNLQMWLDTVITNNQNLVEVIENLQSELEKLSAKIKQAEPDQLNDCFQNAADLWRTYFSE